MKKINFNSQQGFALLFSVFLVVAAMAALSTGFLALTRSQRLSIRENRQTQVRWVAEAAIDRAMKLFGDYAKQKVKQPPLVAGEVCGAPESLGSSTLNDTKQFKTFLQNDWFNSLKALIGDSAVVGFLGGDKHPIFKNITLTVKITQTYVDEVQGLYDIDVTVKDPLSGAESRLIQSIQLVTGRLFDFGVFYDKDLEISPGANGIYLGGPIFSNGNIYVGATATYLMTPGSGKNTLRSAKNIYYGFKRVVAKNYLLNGNFSPERKAAYPAYMKDPSGLEVWQVYPTLPSRYSIDGSPSVRPYFYYFNNERLDISAATSTKLSPGKINLITFNPYAVVDLKYPTSFGNYAAYNLMTGLSFLEVANDDNSKIESAYFLKTAYSNADVSVGKIMSLSFGYEPLNFPQMLPGWTPENPLSTVPPVNPYWTGANVAAKVNSLVKDSVTHSVRSVSVSLGLKGSNTAPNAKHLVIEPLKVGDSADVIKAKLASKAKISFSCANSVCNSFTTQILNADGSVSTDTLSGAVSVSPTLFPDARLETNVKYYDVDMAALTTFIEAKYGSMDKGVLVYFETRSVADAGYSATNSLRVVKLRNGKRLPFKGLTIVTNGRLWIEGDYNTALYDVSGNSTGSYCEKSYNNVIASAPTNQCLVPSTAIFSDSFGVLSNEWDAHKSPFTSSSAWLAGRGVTNPVMVNTGVVTGQMPSQLKKTVPNCDGFDMSKCVYDPRTGTDVADWYPGTRLATGTYVYHWLDKSSAWGTNLAPAAVAEGPRKSWQFNYNKADCPSGLDANGVPVFDPTRPCVYYRDPTSGFYYFSRAALIKAMLSPDPTYVSPYAQLPPQSNKINRQANYFNHMKQRYPLLRGCVQLRNQAKQCGALNTLPDIVLPKDDPFIQAKINELLTAGGGLDFPDNDPVWNTKIDELQQAIMDSFKLTEIPVDNFVGSLSNCPDPYADASVTACNILGNAAANKGKILVDATLTSTNTWTGTWETYDNARADQSRIKTRVYDYFEVSIPHRKLPLYTDGLRNCAGPGAPFVNYTDGVVDLNNCAVNAVLPIPGVGFAPLRNYDNMALMAYSVKSILYFKDSSTTPATIFNGNASDPAVDMGAALLPAWTLKNYDQYNYFPLYFPKYSGGIENLINWQEHWQNKTFYMFGMFGLFWDSQELRKSDGTLAYHEITYFIEPGINHRYYERFITDPPPETPNASLVNRQAFKESKA